MRKIIDERLAIYANAYYLCTVLIITLAQMY